MGYNSVADNAGLLLPPAVQGHLRSSILMSMESLYVSH